MARQCTDIDEVLRSINQRLRKLEKSDSEKTEEIGRLNRIVCQKDKEIHKLKLELTSTKSDLADAKTRIKELEDENDEKDDSAGSSGKPEKNSSNSSVPPSQESIAARELRRTKSLRKPSGKPSGGQPEHKGSTLQSVSTPNRIIKHEPAYCKCRISQRTRRKAGLVSKVYPSASARHRPQTKQNYHAEKDKGAENQDEKPLGRKLAALRRRV